MSSSEDESPDEEAENGQETAEEVEETEQDVEETTEQDESVDEDDQEEDVGEAEDEEEVDEEEVQYGPTPYERTLFDVRELVEELGDEVEQEIYTDEEEQRLVGFRCGRGPNTYIIHGNPDSDGEYLSITYPYNLMLDVSHALARAERAQREEDGEEFDEDEALKINPQAGRKRLMSLAQQNPEEQAYMKEELVDLLCNTDCSYAVVKPDGVVLGFEVTRRIFPDSNDFGMKVLHNAIRTVVSVGIPARNYLQRTHHLTNINIPEATKPADESSSSSGSPGDENDDSLRYIN